jgi:hypothetical protein
MKYLEIKDSLGFYTINGEQKQIDKINKEDLLSLVDLALGGDFEMDPYDPDKLQNKAHQIIYENIFNKINSLVAEKNQFKRKSESMYQKAVNKYGVQESDEINPEDIPF